MRTRNYAAVAAIAATAVAAAAGTANAAPAPATAPAQPVVTNATDFVGAAVHQLLDPTAAQAPVALTIPTGTITVGNGVIGMTGPSGTVTVDAPLAPVSAALAPVAPQLLSAVDHALPTQAAAAVPTTPVAATATAGAPGVHQVAVDPRFKTWNEREQWEFNRLKDTISIGASVGAITGAVVGGAAGCLLGGTALTPTLLFTTVFGPAAGCVTGAVGLAAVGTMGGAILVAAPVAIGAGINYLVQTQQPFTPPPAPPKA